MSQRFVKQAGSLVAGTGINIATVVNFPHGEDPVSTVIADACKAVCDGATEIDLVWPYKAFVRGQESVGQTMIEAVRTALPENVMLKVILETGEISDPHQICRASQIALTAGADMLKTSTGKVPIGATLDAANGMLSAIRDTNSPAGFKASGGIGTLEDAAQYLELADKIMGPEWSCPQTFRFGASSLVGALLSALGPDNHA
jgi:deoxyribose-phosphate aldolase